MILHIDIIIYEHIFFLLQKIVFNSDLGFVSLHIVRSGNFSVPACEIFSETGNGIDSSRAEIHDTGAKIKSCSFPR